MVDTEGVRHVSQLLEERARSRRVTRWKPWLVAAVLLGISAAAIIWARSDKADAPKYGTELVERGVLVVTVTATGSLEPINQVDVGSELSGIIETVEVDYNEQVAAGQVLATLDTDRLEAEVLESKASLSSAQAMFLLSEATLGEAKLDVARTWTLVDQGLSAQSELDAADAAFKRAQANLANSSALVSRSEAALNAKQTNLSKAVIRSPIDGIVLERNVEPGQTVAASLQAPVLFTLAESLSQMELHVDVDEADVGAVRQGQEATFTVDAYSEADFPAHITQLRYASETVEGVVTYEAVLSVDNSDLLLRPGMTAVAEIVVETVEDATLVPNSALRFQPSGAEERSSKDDRGLLDRLVSRRPGQERARPVETTIDLTRQRLWVLEDDHPVAIPIEIGATDGRVTEVIAGDLEPGFPVITDMES